MDEDEYALICSLKAYPSAPRRQLQPPTTTSTAHADEDSGGARAAGTPPVQLSVSEETFAVIKRQAEHRRFRAALRLHRQEKTLKKYIARHGSLSADASSDGITGTAIATAGGGKKKPRESIYQIATSVDFSPCMMARVLLEAKYGWSKTTISNFFKDALAGDSNSTSSMGKETNWRGLGELEFRRLLQEVRECIDRDVYCSPFADRIRHNMGVEYEYLLLEKLRNRKLVYESEDVLREKGLSKTPDVRLLLPFGVRDQQGVLRVVNWIDSKAMFGDRHTHETENAGQLQGYVNRYGSGMVIYWFGHVANLSSDSDVLITHEFPPRIELPGGLDPLENVVETEEKAVLALETQRVVTAFDSEWNPVSTCYFATG